MILAASLGPIAKKAFPAKQCRQKNIQDIIQLLPMEPKVSEAEIILLGPRDMNGMARKKILAAVAAKHADVCVIYMCTNDKEKQLFSEAPNCRQVRRITPDTVKEAVTDFYGDMVKEGTGTATPPVELGVNPTPPVVEEEPASVVEQELPSLDLEEFKLNEPVPEPEPASVPPTRKIPSLEDAIDSAKRVSDWGVLQQQISRDSIIRQLLLDNNEFAGIANMLDVWDVRIRDIWASPSKSNEEKLRAVQEFGANRAVLKAAYNSTLVDKFVSLMERIISVCTATVQERVDEISVAVVKTKTQKADYLDQLITKQDEMTTQMCERIIELNNCQQEMMKMMAFLHQEGLEEIVERLNEQLPSKNEYINHVISTSKQLYYPNNSASLGNQVMEALRKSQISLSAVEDNLIALMNTMFNVISAQNDIVTHQRNAISCLRTNRVESIVVRNSLLKDHLVVMSGKETTGVSSTVATYAGMLSRRGNTLVLDLSEHPHYDRYGYNTTDLEDFLTDYPQNPLLFVTGSVHNDPERVQLLLEELKSRTAYYRYLIVVLDPAQTDALDQIGQEAYCIHYLTNCTPESLDAITAAYTVTRQIPNVAHKIISIDCPVDQGQLMSVVKMDIATTAVVPIPYLREMRQAAMVRQQPHTYNDVLRVFEEAFRV